MISEEERVILRRRYYRTGNAMAIFRTPEGKIEWETYVKWGTRLEQGLEAAIGRPAPSTRQIDYLKNLIHDAEVLRDMQVTLPKPLTLKSASDLISELRQ